MKSLKVKAVRSVRRKKRVRKKVFGVAQRPRLCVSRTLKNINAQIIDDERGVTLCSAGTLDKELRGTVGYGGNKVAAEKVGKALAERAKEKGIETVSFDRSGFKYHGRVKALADAAREGGLKF